MTPQRQEGGRGILRLRAATNRFAIRKQKESRPFAQNDHKGTKHRAALPPQTGRGGLRLTRRGGRAKLSPEGAAQNGNSGFSPTQFKEEQDVHTSNLFVDFLCIPGHDRGRANKATCQKESCAGCKRPDDCGVWFGKVGRHSSRSASRHALG